MKAPRGYTMRARADAVAQTRERVVRAVVELAWETFELEPTLDQIARRAGVSVQTLLRHFGSRDALIDAAVESATALVVEERETPVGDIDAAIRTIVAHYERRGDFVLHLLGHEGDAERIRRVTDLGRRVHREWVRTVFAPWISPEPGSQALVDLLVVATDAYTWKLLRRDRGLSREETEARMGCLAAAVLDAQEGR